MGYSSGALLSRAPLQRLHAPAHARARAARRSLCARQFQEERGGQGPRVSVKDGQGTHAAIWQGGGADAAKGEPQRTHRLRQAQRSLNCQS